MKKQKTFWLIALALGGNTLLTAQTVHRAEAVRASTDGPAVLLKAEEFHPYVRQFVVDEQEATGSAPADTWPWMKTEIPLFASSDKRFEKIYYFRWYAWQKHLVNSAHGFLITEWLPKPQEKDGNFGALPDAAPFHLAEARWLHNPAIARDYAKFWIAPDARPRLYSFPLAETVRQVALAHGDAKLGPEMLDGLVANYRGWEASNLDASTGMYWQIDTRDAMEKSISGDGYRPPLMSYQAADARAIAAIAHAAGRDDLAAEFDRKASALEGLIEGRLWNPKDEFYEVISPAADSGIRKQKKFIDPGTQMQFSGVRELIGYLPFLYTPVPANHLQAWKQLFDPQGFAGRFGPTTAERRSPRFRFATTDQCTWNGPAWPFATTQTLLALARVLQSTPQSVIRKEEYYQLFSNYVDSMKIQLPSGRTIEWLDEDQDADSGEWIAKRMLAEKHKQVGRGNYYNHSGFADPLITGLIGLRPREDAHIELRPLLPAGQWRWFAMDRLPYHGHMLTIVFDADGKHFHRGRGFQVYVDGKKRASRPTLGPLDAALIP